MRGESSKSSHFDRKQPNNIEDLKIELVEALDEEIQKIEEERLGASLKMFKILFLIFEQPFGNHRIFSNNSMS